MKRNSLQYFLLPLAVLAAIWAVDASATVTVTDNFTGQSASIPWVALNDACLTAGNGSGTIPACGTDNTPSASSGSTTAGNGALQLTPNTTGQTGAIVDPVPFPSNAGLTVTFNTYTFGGNNFGGTGADGIGFYLINGEPYSAPTSTNPLPQGQSVKTNGSYGLAPGFALGALGGSGGYQCSNTNYPANGMPGAYLGLGIDEYGNFVNGNGGPENPENNDPFYYGDNTGTGPGFYPNSMGMRGYGDINANSIATMIENAGDQLPNGGINNSDVQAVCGDNGNINEALNYSGVADLPDYAYIPGSLQQLPESTEPIFNQENKPNPTIAKAIPISYKITLTPSGLLSLAYSYNNGAYVTAINQQSISATNGPLPSYFLFGFGASTGGGSNYHDITCFQAGPANQSSSSASVNVQQTGEVQTATQVYLAYYSPDNWWGRLTAQNIQVNSSTGAVTVNPNVNWDAACVLTGGTCTSTYAGGAYPQPTSSTPPQSYTTMPVLTWSGSAGIPFTWTSGLTSTEQGWLNGGGSSTGFGQELVHYLKGDTKYNVTSFNASDTTTPQFRTRTEILGDIIDSSPVWVGAPDEGLPNTFSNALYPSLNATYAQNASGAESYSSFATNEAGRNNVVYVGANDGMLHGFQSGSFSGSTFNTSTNNGKEVLGYVPYAVLEGFDSQINTSSDYAYPGYGHNFYVDATPGTDDAFYGNKWHTLLVSALGSGGRGIFALDITNPETDSASTVTTPSASTVLADFTFANKGLVPSNATKPSPSNFVGVNVTGKNTYEATMGDVSGTPIIRLMNNGDYAIITGNGQNSDDGEAGIFIFLIDPTATGFTIKKTIFLGTGVGSLTSPDGINYVSSASLNGDHFVDYLYAGDSQGNVWRFNVTSNSSSNWRVSTYGQQKPTPLFSAGPSQPIVSRILVNSNIGPTGAPQLMLQFGTGSYTPLTVSSAATYATSQQAIYTVWDWDMGGWNALPGATKYVAGPAPLDITLKPANLVAQSITAAGVTSNGAQAVNVSSNSVCWAGSTSCQGAPKYGSYLPLPSVTSNGTTLYQQVVYNPSFVEGAAVFDTTIPPYNNAYTCTSGLQSGFTYALSPLTGGAIPSGFFRSSGNNGTAITLGGIPVSGLQLNATGSPAVVEANGNPVMVQQTVNGNPVATEVFPAGGMGSQVNWIELR